MKNIKQIVAKHWALLGLIVAFLIKQNAIN
jgi:hypothetical protein